MDLEDLKSYIDRTFATKEDLRTEVAGLRTEISDKFEEAKRHSSVLHEDIVSRLELLVEIVTPYGPKLEAHDRRLDALEADVGLLKLAVQKR